MVGAMGPGQRARIVGRRVAVALVVVVQLGFVVRAYGSDHRDLGWQMFPEASTWRADVTRVTADGRRVPIEVSWDGYRWAELVPSRGLAYPGTRHHADAGLDNQLAFLDAALDWVADHTPRDDETLYLEAEVTAWRNGDPPVTSTLRSDDREEAG
jgi:hypothetical protein